MIKKAIILLFILSNGAMAQINIKGIIVDETSQSLPSASVALLTSKDSTVVKSVLSQPDGSFLFSKVQLRNYVLKISFIGYESKIITLERSSDDIDLGNIPLKNIGNLLNDVVVKADKEPLSIKKDTLEFDATVLKPQANDNLEDLVKKVPTLEIDENGVLKTQTKTIRKVMVDGKEFFGNDPNLALKNLPAEAIEKIQVIEKKTDAAEFAGIDDGEREVILNVSLKKTHKKGTIGFASAGWFPKVEAQKTDYYNLKTSINRFSSKNQFSVIGFYNNINLQGFTPQDVSNFANLNRQQNRGNSGASSNPNTNVNLPIVVGKRPGLIQSTGFGLNYNNQYGEKSSLQSSYFYNQGSTNLIRDLERQSFLPEKEILTNQKVNQVRDNGNHRLNFTVNHEFSPKNTIRLISNVNIVSGNAETESDTKIKTTTATNQVENKSLRRVLNFSDGQSINNNVLFRHRFERPRRIMSLNLVHSINHDKSNDSTNTKNQNVLNGQTTLKEINQFNERKTNQNSNRIQISYTEPIALKLSLEGSYAYQLNINNSDFMVWDIVNNLPQINVNLTNSFKNEFIFQQTGLKLNRELKDKTWVLAGFYQASLLKSYVKRGTDNTLRRTFENFLPMFRFTFRESNTKNTTVEYNTSVNEPSVKDLQPITINNNPQNIFVGNPDLKPEYNHRFTLTQNYFRPKTFQNLNINGNLNFVKNAISYAQFISETLARTTKPVNTAFRWNTSLNLNYTFPLSKKHKNKFRLSINPRWFYAERNSLINGIENLNSQNQWNGLMKLTFLTDKINLVINQNFQKTFAKYSVNTEYNQHFSIFKSNIDLKWNFTKKTAIATEFDFTNYQNSRFASIQRNIPILNFSLKQLCLKNNRGEISASVQDFFNRNIYFSQRSDDNFFELERSNTLGRFYMISFMYSVKRQGKKAQ